MKWFVSLLSVIVIGLGSLGEACAAEPAARKPIRVLLLYGGHGFEEKPFFAMFDALEGVHYVKAEMPKAADLLKPGLEKRYDVIVRYDMTVNITPQQQADLLALLRRGIGLVSLHHSIATYDDWDEYHEVLGCHYYLHPVDTAGKKHDRSRWKEGCVYRIHVADKEHPITRGLADFTIHDETYGDYEVRPTVHMLLTTDDPRNAPSIAWVKEYGKSRVFYLQSGHDSKAWHNPMYPELLLRGIRWAAGK